MNSAYAGATLTRREKIVGERMFNVFPDDPDDPEATGVSNLFNSLRVAAETGRAHAMPVQRYDIRGAEGKFIPRFWQPMNTPILDEKGHIMALLHHVIDVTAQHHPTNGSLMTDELSTEAFIRAWRFVERDPFLAHHSHPVLRDHLQASIAAQTKKGERDLLTLANVAIWQLRDQFGRQG